MGVMKIATILDVDSVDSFDLRPTSTSMVENPACNDLKDAAQHFKIMKKFVFMSKVAQRGKILRIKVFPKYLG